jgi:hypothetical protein
MLLMGVGCGKEEQEVRTVTVERQVTVQQASPARRNRPKPHSSAPEPDGFVDCDANIQAKADTTTCPFAQNVFWTYWTSGQSSEPFEVWSPAARASFATTCTRDVARIACTTSDNAVVKFSQTAVDSYSKTQADAYASSHDLGPDPYEDLPDTGSFDEEGGGSDDCQGYDPCIPPGADVDCAGGSGDGPRYVGTVSVHGADPYDLDRDGDGIGCDT